MSPDTTHGPACARWPARPPTLCGCLPVSPSPCSGVCSTGVTASCRTLPTAEWRRSTSRWTPGSTATSPSRCCAATWPRTRRSSAGSGARPARRPGCRTPTSSSVFDQGEDDGHMFLAMEYVPGQTLREVMKAEGPLTPRAALDIMGPVLQALGAAHRGGIIHRDVKPENIILREDDGTVKVADFGLARAVSNQTSHLPDRRAARHGGLPVPRAGRARHRRRPQRRVRRRADPVRDAHRAPRRSPATPRSTSPTSTCTARSRPRRRGSPRCPPSSTPWWPWRPRATPTTGPTTPTTSSPRSASRARCSPPTELDRRPEGPRRAGGGGASTVAVERTSALPVRPPTSRVTPPRPAAPVPPRGAADRPHPDRSPRAARPRRRHRRRRRRRPRAGPWRWIWRPWASP